MIAEPTRERLVVTVEPKKLRIESEIYLAFIRKSFVPVVDVFDIKKKREYFLICSAQSLCEPLFVLLVAGSGKLKDTEVWISKVGEEKMAKYVVEAV